MRQQPHCYDCQDEYVLGESYSGEEEGDEREGSDSETDSEIGRLRDRKEELERARQKEKARARKSTWTRW